MLMRYSSLLKNAGVRQVVLDKWFPLKGIKLPSFCAPPPAAFHPNAIGAHLVNEAQQCP